MRLKCTVAYDGAQFDGWQKQPRGRTIQTSIEQCLRVIHKQDVRVFGSGRTDAGVHAWGQVFHFDTDLIIETSNWVKAMNANLPDDIRIMSVETVADDFHARFSAKSKTYRYQINLGQYNLFERQTVYQLNQDLDVDAMKHSAMLLLGTHDFTSFNASSLEEIPDQVRTLYAIDLSLDQDILTITLNGSGFLRYMVRMIVGVLIACGQHRLTDQEVQNALNIPSKQQLSLNVPACGLTLMKVDYEL